MFPKQLPKCALVLRSLLRRVGYVAVMAIEHRLQISAFEISNYPSLCETKRSGAGQTAPVVALDRLSESQLPRRE
jgi:hypothetical protein